MSGSFDSRPVGDQVWRSSWSMDVRQRPDRPLGIACRARSSDVGNASEAFSPSSRCPGDNTSGCPTSLERAEARPRMGARHASLDGFGSTSARDVSARERRRGKCSISYAGSRKGLAKTGPVCDGGGGRAGSPRGGVLSRANKIWTSLRPLLATPSGTPTRGPFAKPSYPPISRGARRPDTGHRAHVHGFHDAGRASARGSPLHRLEQTRGVAPALVPGLHSTG